MGDKNYLYSKKEALYINSEDATKSQCEEIIVKSILENASSGKSRFVPNLASLINQLAFGNINEFSHQINLWHNTIRILLKGNILPTWKILDKISLSTRISIVDLLITPRLKVSKNLEYKKYLSVNLKQLLIDCKDDDEKVERTIQMYSFEYPPLSAREIARRIGYSSSDRIKVKYPDLYKQIVDKYLYYVQSKKIILPDKDIEQLFTNASREEPPPSLQSVFRRIGCYNTGYRYYNKFPQLCLLISKRYKRSVSLLVDREKAKNTLIEALRETPPPSLSEMARRLKCKRESLKRLFPKLITKMISKRKKFLSSQKENLHRKINL